MLAKQEGNHVGLDLQQQIVTFIESLDLSKSPQLFIIGCKKGWGDVSYRYLAGVDDEELLPAITSVGFVPVTEDQAQRLNQTFMFLRRHEQECGTDHKPSFFSHEIWDDCRDNPSGYAKIWMEDLAALIKMSEEYA